MNCCCDGKRIMRASPHRAGFDYPMTPAGSTAHVDVYYGTALGMQGQALAKACLLTCEAAWQGVAALFGPSVALPRATFLIAPLSPSSNGQGGAYHRSCADTILYCDASFGQPQRSSALFVAELSECAQAISGNGWNCGASPGEGLSRFDAELAYPGALDDYETASVWLDGARKNWIDSSNPTDQQADSNGCSVLFLFWLVNLGYTPAQITQAPGGTLAATYQKLTGKSTAWADFSAAVNAKWPPGRPSGVRTDDPWGPPQTPVTISISPASATIATGGKQQFTATVSQGSVKWSATAGTVDATGLFVAASTAGVCSVVATSTMDQSKTATASVIVTDTPPTKAGTVMLRFHDDIKAETIVSFDLVPSAK